MEQYILKSAVVAEIESLLDKGKYHEEYDCAYRDGNNGALDALKNKLDTLEIKDVDLDREIRRYRMRNPIIQHREESLYDYMANVAKHFFELGLKAQLKNELL